MRARYLVLTFALVSWGCSAEFPVSLIPDASTVDAAPPPDAAPEDGSVSPDGAPPDAAPTDAAPPDAAPPDAAPGCGDGTISGGEGCDDGNTTAGDGCDPSCQVESGWTCTGTPSTCTPICGDNQVVGDEQCDDGNTTDGDGCNSACLVECSNGSTSDCNSAGETLNAAAAFVDPAPPAGFIQCAGFENTAQNDVGPNWEAHCLGAVRTLRVRLWDTRQNPWVLRADGTLTPQTAATYTTQLFGVTNHVNDWGFLETDGFTLLADDPAGSTISSLDCQAGPATRHYQATDLYFANQANDRFFVVSGNSLTDDAAAIQTDDEEISRMDHTYEECTNSSLNSMTELAIAIYYEL